MTVIVLGKDKMAQRPVFKAITEGNCLVQSELIDFKFYNGYSIEQKHKSITELHHAIKQKHNNAKILEVSTKSNQVLGVKLSAFNLMINDKKNNISYSVECAYQASKRFENSGPYRDILNKSSLDAKKDKRILTSGAIVGFEFYGTTWGLIPFNAFYDWLYINALKKHEELHQDLIQYNYFTDIEFNHKKSINCQAHAIAMFISLYKKNLLNTIRDPEVFLNLYKEYRIFDSSFSNNKIELQEKLF
ncbi:hypothetical protein QM268_04585 [Acinetobacter baumannii]|nr:hypothetical protein [Acinetobacter baumannii]MDI9691731.1 hypothetical protein [Acinetobacter baumannii]